jgi:hypothetical protein
VIFVANGAGDLRGTTEGFCAAVEECKLPYRVETFCWSCCPGPGLADLVNGYNHKVQGELLASKCIAWRANHPHDRICLVGHSAGAAVVLAAAEHLPSCYLDHVILLAPAISSHFDVRPALKGVRCGIDVYYSHHDCFLPPLWIFGVADHRWVKLAGIAGFRCQKDSEEAEALCACLHQHKWDPEMKEAGHHGGHFGWTGKDFIKAYILPLLLD